MSDDESVTSPNAKPRPGPGRRAGIDSGDTRQQVIDAACRCFAQFGYGPATNSVIAEMAGVTAGSVHYHFGSKRNLFEAVCDDVYGKIIGRSTVAMAGPRSVSGLLRAVLEESMRINHESPELAGFVATAPIDARRHRELTDAFARQAVRMTETLAMAVRQGQEGGLIPADRDPVEIAQMISAVVDGFAHAAASLDPPAMDSMTELFESLVLDNDVSTPSRPTPD
ncbi:TetR family transcriptional regulator [Mycobacterium intermedium]|uniref:TetR family transcriptional regulator n=1 Tax=Mycobacterium intermedium TaxID=28445 RepID=A0A1E3SL37_MYCIE|nr:TetR/AcrR family transcriptional regulator [Mycobacterium intermedium]ODR02856.1 TetR family transcriptional regulator [Mycobacterium intermedium]OPE49916.1 TetR family transcriptional regulator [Mycobacterium intermedium]ORB02767.1 TetR family transcriptional regulator [Mycobacterium intermedium]